jgi:Domain of unknown function (DUF4251)
MKFHNAFILIPLFLVAGNALFNPSNSNTQEDIKQAIQSDRWIFKAQSANPQGGRTQMLTSEYEMRTAKDTIICYLPYFGRSYSGAGAMTNANPLDFKSTSFTIDKEEKKKGGWKVTIKFKDVNAIRSMNFELYENGSANLNVTLTDRTPITFLGRIEPLH